MPSIAKAIADRFANAGGLYNAGNILDLYAVAAHAIVERSPSNVTEALTSVRSALVGDASSTFLSCAAGGFFVGGEAYHRAWAKGFPPNREANFFGDFFSGCGAVLLGCGLYGLGDPLLAATSGGLHAASKFGSSLSVSETLSPHLTREFKMGAITTTAADVLKDLALISRVPAFAVCALNITNNFVSLPLKQAVANSMMPAMLGWCYSLWARADWQLTQRQSMIRQTVVKVKKPWDKWTEKISIWALSAMEEPSDRQVRIVPTGDQGRKFLSSYGVIATVGTLIALVGPAVTPQILPLAIPLILKTAWTLAKAGTEGSNARCALERQKKDNHAQPTP